MQGTLAETETGDDTGETSPAPVAARPWPKKMAEQLGAVRDMLGGTSGLWTAGQVAAAFTGAKAEDVTPVLESLATLGHLLAFEGEDGPRWKAV